MPRNLHTTPPMKEVTDLPVRDWQRLIDYVRKEPPDAIENEEKLQARCSAAAGLSSRRLAYDLIIEACHAARVPTLAQARQSQRPPRTVQPDPAEAPPPDPVAPTPTAEPPQDL